MSDPSTSPYKPMYKVSKYIHINSCHNCTFFASGKALFCHKESQASGLYVPNTTHS